MTRDIAPAARPPITFERCYDAAIEDLWDLWTTKEGFESWWGPQGFRVEIHTIDARAGGELFYDMIAADAEQIAHLKRMGMPASHETRGRFVEVEPRRRLKILHVIDFIPGLKPYDNNILVEFIPEGSSVRMVVTLEQHQEEEWTRRAAAGFESQLTKLPGVLAVRHN
jgi:uncharacterized protein YndB with AHSA1/START domain